MEWSGRLVYAFKNKLMLKRKNALSMWVITKLLSPKFWFIFGSHVIKKSVPFRPSSTHELLKKKGKKFCGKCPIQSTTFLCYKIKHAILKAVEISDLVKTPSLLLIFEDLRKKERKTFFFHFCYNGYIFSAMDCVYVSVSNKKKKRK